MNNMTIGQKVTMHGKPLSVSDVRNVTGRGSCGPDEILYTFEGCGDDPIKMMDYEVCKLISDGAFVVE